MMSCVALFSFVVASRSVSSALAQQNWNGPRHHDGRFGAVIPAAPCTLSGNGVTKTAQTQADGSYIFPGLPPGEYTVKAVLPGFRTVNKAVKVRRRHSCRPIQMRVNAEKQEVTVKPTPAPPLSAWSRIITPPHWCCNGADLDALPDDPDDLADALQALAGPGAGPNGGADLHRRLHRRPACLPRNPSARSASTRTPSPPNTTGWASAASRSSPSRAPTGSAAASCFNDSDGALQLAQPVLHE